MTKLSQAFERHRALLAERAEKKPQKAVVEREFSPSFDTNRALRRADERSLAGWRKGKLTEIGAWGTLTAERENKIAKRRAANKVAAQSRRVNRGH